MESHHNLPFQLDINYEKVFLIFLKQFARHMFKIFQFLHFKIRNMNNTKYLVLDFYDIFRKILLDLEPHN